MSDIILKIPKKNKSTKGGHMGDNKDSVSQSIYGLIDLEEPIDNLDTSGHVIKPTRSLIFNG